jgi:hypothetical protein
MPPAGVVGNMFALVEAQGLLTLRERKTPRGRRKKLAVSTT